MLAEGGLAGVVVGRCCPGEGGGRTLPESTLDTQGWAQSDSWLESKHSGLFTRIRSRERRKYFLLLLHMHGKGLFVLFFFFFFFLMFVGLLSTEKLFLWHTNVYDYDVKISLGGVYSAAWSEASASSGIPPSSFTICNPALLIWFGSPSFPTLPSHCSGLWPGLSPAS